MFKYFEALLLSKKEYNFAIIKKIMSSSDKLEI